MATLLLSEAAKQAGVSPAAPYRHFDERSDSLVEIACQGFEIFADLLEFAYRKEKTDMRRFESIGRAYLAFAHQHPRHYIAMFESGVSINANADLAANANRAMSVLANAAQKLSTHLPTHMRPP